MLKVIGKNFVISIKGKLYNGEIFGDTYDFFLCRIRTVKNNRYVYFGNDYLFSLVNIKKKDLIDFYYSILHYYPKNGCCPCTRTKSDTIKILSALDKLSNNGCCIDLNYIEYV